MCAGRVCAGKGGLARVVTAERRERGGPPETLPYRGVGGRGAHGGGGRRHKKRSGTTSREQCAREASACGNERLRWNARRNDSRRAGDGKETGASRRSDNVFRITGLAPGIG